MTRRGKTLVAALLALSALVFGWKFLSRSVEEARPAVVPAPRAEPPGSLNVLELPVHERPVQELAPATPPDVEPPPAAFPVVAAAEPGAPHVRGRVLLPDGVTPAAGASVHLDETCQDGYHDTQTTDVAGRFSCPSLSREPLDALELRVLTADKFAWTWRQGIALHEKSDKDLGDIVLEPVRSLRLTVRGADGRPVPGAVAVVVGEERLISDAAGADGQIALEPIPQAFKVVEVWARGFATASLRVPDPFPVAPLDVTLQACPLLTLHVAAADGSSAEGFTVALKTRETLFRTVHEAGDGSLRLGLAANTVGLTVPGSMSRCPPTDSSKASEVMVVFWPTGPDAIVLGDLQPGVELELTLLDGVNFPAWGPTSLTLAPAERRELELRPNVPAKCVLVRVRDPLGRPVESAWVGLAGPGMVPSAEEQTETDGVAAFGVVVAARGEIGVYAPPWARTVLRDVDLPPEAPIDVTVPAGLKVKLRLVDGSGRPARADRLFIIIDGHRFPRGEFLVEPSPASEFELDALPVGWVLLDIVHGDEHAEREIDCRNAEATVSVPWSDGT